MIDFISTYFIRFAVIRGGVRVDIGYAGVVLLLWIMSHFLKRMFAKKALPT